MRGARIAFLREVTNPTQTREVFLEMVKQARQEQAANERHRRFGGFERLAGHMENCVGAFGVPIQELHGFFRWEDDQFNLASPRLKGSPHRLHLAVVVLLRRNRRQYPARSVG